MAFTASRVAAALALVVGTAACPPNDDESADCTVSFPSSPILVNLDGTGLPASDFVVVVIGSAGDKPVLVGGRGLFGPQFTGEGRTDETYHVTISLSGIVFYSGTIGLSAEDCAFLLDIETQDIDGGLPFDSST